MNPARRGPIWSCGERGSRGGPHHRDRDTLGRGHLARGERALRSVRGTKLVRDGSRRQGRNRTRRSAIHDRDGSADSRTRERGLHEGAVLGEVNRSRGHGLATRYLFDLGYDVEEFAIRDLPIRRHHDLTVRFEKTNRCGGLGGGRLGHRGGNPVNSGSPASQ